MPISHRLIGIGEAEHCGLVVRPTNELESNGEPQFRESTRNRESRQPQVADPSRTPGYGIDDAGCIRRA